MTDEFVTVRLRILGEDYTIACDPQDRDLLQNAAPLLDEQINALHDQDPTLESSKVFMLAALKLASSLLQSQRQTERDASETADHVRSLRRRMERRLKKAGGGGVELPAAS